MRTINNLTGIALEAADPNLHVGFAMCSEPAPGFMRQMRMGITGMVLSCGQSQLFIPTEAFWALAEASDPSFKAPAAKAARKAGG
jgi:hypothetical protein